MRIFVKYSKKGMLRFLGHLDTQRLFMRALRRSSLPLKYSEGFSPKPEISFAYPLSVGIETEGDYFEFSTAVDVDTEAISSVLHLNVPDGIGISAVGRVADGTDKIMNLPKASRYTICAGQAFSDWMSSRFMPSGSYMIKRIKKGKETLSDIRPFVRSVEIDGENCTILIEHTSGGSLSPMVLLGAAEEDLDQVFPEKAVTRTDIYTIIDGALRPIEDIFIF